MLSAYLNKKLSNKPEALVDLLKYWSSTKNNPSITMINIVKQNQSVAGTALVSAGLVVGRITIANHDTIPIGQVISSNPAAGASVTSDSSVALVISAGPSSKKTDTEKSSDSGGGGTSTFFILLLGFIGILSRRRK